MPKWFKISKYLLHVRHMDGSSFLRINFAIQNLGVHPHRVRQKKAPPVECESAISQKQCKIRDKLLLFSQRKLHMGLSVGTEIGYVEGLNDLEGLNCIMAVVMLRYFTKIGHLGINYVTVVEVRRSLDPYF